METDQEMALRHKKVCARCIHYSRVNKLAQGSCVYILDTGQRRPCPGSDCVKKGIFKPGKRKESLSYFIDSDDDHERYTVVANSIRW